MATTATPIFPQTIQNYAVQILPADTTTVKTLATGGTNGTKIDWINIASSDTAARDLQIWLSDGTTNHLLTTLSVAITAGFTNTITPVALFVNSQSPFLSFDSSGNKFLYLKSGWSLKAGVLTAVTAAKAIYITAQGEDF